MRQAPAASVHRLEAAGRAEPLALSRQVRIGLQVEHLRTTAAGQVVLPESDQHRLKMHASGPVRGSCAAHKFVYLRGQLDLMPPGYSDRWTEEDPGLALIVQLSSGLLSRAAEDLGLDPARATIDYRHQFSDPQIEHLVWALEADRSAGSPHGVLYADCLGHALAVHLLGRYRAPRDAARGLDRDRLRRVTDYIESHLERDLTLTELARVASLSGSHFKTLFKASVGLPVHTYVIQRRVERAKTLLQESRLSAAQVALDAGFAHQSHMARCMRRVLGITPSALMRRP